MEKNMENDMEKRDDAGFGALGFSVSLLPQRP